MHTNPTSPRTIVMLSQKRCGSTAMFQVFQRHPQVGVCHVDQSIENAEPNFWNYAADALAGNDEKFRDRLSKDHPYLEIPERLTEEAVFDLWDRILARLGPIVFDKSPKYLNSQAGLDLLKKYRDRGNDVRLFAFIRDPRDAISSQYELWNKDIPEATPQYRESFWLDAYARLEKFRAEWGAPLPYFRYEDVVSAPVCYLPTILAHCGLEQHDGAWAHIKPVNVGRHKRSRNLRLRLWRPSEDFKTHLKNYGYM